MLENSNNNTFCLLKLLENVHVNVVIKSLCTNICSSLSKLDTILCGAYGRACGG